MHTGSKFGKSLGKGTEKGSYQVQEMKAQPLAMAVTLPVQPHQNLVSTHQMQWMLIALGDVPRSNASIAER